MSDVDVPPVSFPLWESPSFHLCHSEEMAVVNTRCFPAATATFSLSKDLKLTHISGSSVLEKALQPLEVRQHAPETIMVVPKDRATMGIQNRGTRGVKLCILPRGCLSYLRTTGVGCEAQVRG